MEQKVIKAGDVVTLASGSPLMIVDKVLPERALCFWWAKRKRGPVGIWLPLTILTVVPDSN